MKENRDLKNLQANEEELKQVNGGIIFNSTGISGADPKLPYEVLDYRGDVQFRSPDYNGAVNFALSNGYSIDYKDINNWDEIQDLRNRTH